jgi:hypothetical protein
MNGTTPNRDRARRLFTKTFPLARVEPLRRRTVTLLR